MSRFPDLIASVEDGDGARSLRLKGRRAEILRQLVKAGDRGVTQLETIQITSRLASYVFRLKNDNGLLIMTERESHGDGTHGRYKLASRVSLDLFDGQAPA